MKTVTIFRCPPHDTLDLCIAITNKLGIPAWSPHTEKWAIGRKSRLVKRYVPVLPSYIFIHRMHTELITRAQFPTVRKMMINGKHATVSTSELKRIKNPEDLEKKVFTSEKTQYIPELGEEVVPTQGPLKGIPGTVREVRIKTSELLVEIGQVKARLSFSAVVPSS